jgi:hypothetical protein
VLDAVRRRLARPRSDTSLEGVYAAPERRLHYVLADSERTLCGRSVRELGLHRWASQWSLTEPDRRCKRCDRLVGPRGEERHGTTTAADVVLLGLQPPGLSASQSAALRIEQTRSAARFRSVAPPEGVTFRDPPFELATDPHRHRGVLEPPTDRVVNEVYAQVRKGTRWHRIVGLSQTAPDERLTRYGRTFEAACSYPVQEFEWAVMGQTLERSIVSTERPPDDLMCQACLGRFPSSVRAEGRSVEP